MVGSYKAAPDIDVLTSNVAIPGLGVVPVDAFVLHGTCGCRKCIRAG
jgi:hypothetical protein